MILFAFGFILGAWVGIMAMRFFIVAKKDDKEDWDDDGL